MNPTPRYAPGSPEARKAGSLLCDGFYAALVQLAGDLDYFAMWVGVPRWSSHTKLCALCRATFKGPLSWLDNREGSGWQQSLLTAANWKTHWNPDSQLFRIPGLNGLCIALDFMHNHFLGWVQYFYGSVCVLLVNDILEGTPLQNLQWISHFLKDFQKRKKSRYVFKPRWDNF